MQQDHIHTRRVHSLIWHYQPGAVGPTLARGSVAEPKVDGLGVSKVDGGFGWLHAAALVGGGYVEGLLGPALGGDIGAEEKLKGFGPLILVLICKRKSIRSLCPSSITCIFYGKNFGFRDIRFK